MTKRIAAIALFAAVAAAAIAPIRSYDYFWHLAAGRWIVEHHALPLDDPLAVASVKTPWINGEWLYEAALYATHAGDAFTSLLNALFFERWIAAGVSAAALLVNPYGWRAIRAPFELTSLASSGEFVNAEWLPSDPKLFPLLYVTAAVVALALLIAPGKRANLWR